MDANERRYLLGFQIFHDPPQLFLIRVYLRLSAVKTFRSVYPLNLTALLLEFTLERAARANTEAVGV